MKHARKAFTLIELLIVIAIIAILALIAIPNFLEAQTRAKVSRVHADMRSLATALEAYFVDNNAYPRASPHSSYDNTNLGYQHYLFWIGTHKHYRRSPFLTTPVGYITTYPWDPFPAHDLQEATDFGTDGTFELFSYYYINFHGAALNKHLAPSYPSYSGKPYLSHTLVQPMPVKLNGETGKTYNTMFALVSAGPDKHTEETLLDNPSKSASLGNLLYNKNYLNWLQQGKFPTYDPTNGTVSRGNIWRCQGLVVE